MPPATFDYYEALEIERTATNEEIKSSYRRLARIHHPDKNLDNPESTAAFQKVNRTLSKATPIPASQNLVLILRINIDPDCARNTI
jgi:preprotein translocase subunit Sec63